MTPPSGPRDDAYAAQAAAELTSGKLSPVRDVRIRELYDLHGPALLRYLTGFTYGQPQLAEDLVQETLVRAWRNLESLNPDPNALRPWLFTVARRVAIDAARARRARPAQTDDTDIADLPLEADPIDQMLSAHTVRRAMQRLSREHYQVIVELYYRGRTVAEVALRLGIPEGTVKSRAHYGLRSLRVAIGTLNDIES